MENFRRTFTCLGMIGFGLVAWWAFWRAIDIVINHVFGFSI